MKNLAAWTLVVWSAWSSAGNSAVDTLKGASDIEESTIYGFANCDGETSGEDCRDYNAGGTSRFRVGRDGFTDNHHTCMQFPGWDQTVPDSSVLKIYCKAEQSSSSFNYYVYPLTQEFITGTELDALLGNVPDDSGVTWRHCWLDTTDADTCFWSSIGSDYTTAYADTITVTDTLTYFEFDHFNRILNYFDSTGTYYGVVFVAQSGSNTRKGFYATDYGSNMPLLMLFTATSEPSARRRKILLGGY